MKKQTLALTTAAAALCATASASAQQMYVEYYRSNLFLGLAYHRIGCLTDWTTIRSDQDYDGFSVSRYCYDGSSSEAVPDGEWFAWNYAEGKAQLDSCGAAANAQYGTPGYSERSQTCNYNVLFNCNSDCWIRAFSSCQGKSVPIASPCW